LGFLNVAPSGTKNSDAFFVGRRPKPRATVHVPAALGRHRMNPLVRPAALLVKRALRRGLGVQVTRASYAVDRAASRAFSPTDASFAVYTRDLDSADVQRIREALLAVRLPDGRAAIEEVWSPEELYGRQDATGPTLLFVPAHGVRPSAVI